MFNRATIVRGISAYPDARPSKPSTAYPDAFLQGDWKAVKERLDTPLIGSMAKLDRNSRLQRFWGRMNVTGRMALMDVIHYGLMSEHDTLLNLRSESWPCVPGPTPGVFSEDLGLVHAMGQTTSAGLIPGVGTKFQLPSAHIAILMTQPQGTGSDPYVQRGGGADVLRMVMRAGGISGGVNIRLNSGSAGAVTREGSGIGAWVGVRDGNQLKMWHGRPNETPVKLIDATVPPTEMPSSGWRFGGNNSIPQTGAHSLHTAGAAMSDDQVREHIADMLATRWS